eukprot:TRINITY_DN1186_c0_g1_i7.p1 TRINITY_DN1186_c0_g1~~TRINITY_DN1186_c0_g1_i7.p1  ORF type:complete len:214 (+),score=20.24 TRINITY_DN1186_c0_g1_i7:171-812(+)
MCRWPASGCPGRAGSSATGAKHSQTQASATRACSRCRPGGFGSLSVVLTWRFKATTMSATVTKGTRGARQTTASPSRTTSTSGAGGLAGRPGGALDESASLICKADGSAAIHMCGFVHHGFGLEDGNNTVTCSGGVAFAADGRVSIHGTYVSAGETWYRTGDTVTCAVRDRKALLLVNGEERRAVPITEKEFTPGERMVLACSCYRDAAWEAC